MNHVWIFTMLNIFSSIWKISKMASRPNKFIHWQYPSCTVNKVHSLWEENTLYFNCHHLQYHIFLNQWWILFYFIWWPGEHSIGFQMGAIIFYVAYIYVLDYETSNELKFSHRTMIIFTKLFCFVLYVYHDFNIPFYPYVAFEHLDLVKPNILKKEDFFTMKNWLSRRESMIVVFDRFFWKMIFIKNNWHWVFHTLIGGMM
jgi:hypothetical protein